MGSRRDFAPERAPQRDESIGQSMPQPDGPRNRCGQRHRQIKPPGLPVAIEVGAEAGKVVLQEENAEELRRAELDQRKPGSGNCQKERNARRVNRTEQGARIALRGAEGDENEGSQHRSDRSLGEHCDGVESVEEKEEDFPTSADCGQKWGPLRSGFQCWCPISAFFWQKWGSWAAIVHTRALVPAKPR